MSSLKIPFLVAIFININIVIGGAFFLGVQKITAECGLLSPFLWLLCGLILVPLVAVFANLAREFPQAGGIYVYSHETLGQWWGYLSGITYFIGGIAGNAVLIHEFVLHAQETHYLSGILKSIGLTDLNFEIFITLLFALFNLCNIQFMGVMQTIFTLLKIIPIAIVLLGAILLFDINTLSAMTFNYTGLHHALPIVFFAYIGIEACSAIIDKIENAKKNGPKLLWFSFALMVLIYVVLQVAILCIFSPGQTNPFLSVIPRLTSYESLIFWGNGLILGAILISFLAGFYGSFYYNNWNIYAIAENKNIVGSNHLAKLNSNGVPWLCVFTQATIIIMLLAANRSTHYLLTMSDFSVTIAFFLTALSFLKIYKGHKKIIGYLALLSCVAFMYIAITNLHEGGLYALVPFLGIMGICLVLYKRKIA